jgi:exosortase C (VPDSG-CTERM-specific)
VPALAAPGNRLPAQMFSFCLLLYASGYLVLGSKSMREAIFPALFLLFMLPFPPVIEHAIEWFLQHSTAEVAYRFIQWSGIPVLRRGLSFEMPGISLSVAPECSGIRSSWVLLITSLLAGHLFLKPRWKRSLLALIVIPLGIIRNAFRILVLSLLCVHLDPSWIDSPLHHRGGPIFFVLSLIPFTIILIWLLKTENHPPASSTSTRPASPPDSTP